MKQPFEKYIPLIKDGFIQRVKPYPIKTPEIKTGAAYYFETDSGLRYEVLFAKKKNNYLENIINFSVLNEEFDDEYSVTNRGEIYRVISTVIVIILIYHTSYSLVGIPYDATLPEMAPETHTRLGLSYWKRYTSRAVNQTL